MRWVGEPHWSQLAHDLAVADFRLAVERSACDVPELALEGWLSEKAFRSHADMVEFSLSGGDGRVRQEKRGSCPDGYFVIMDEEWKREGIPARARFLVELDVATHDKPPFASEKAIPGLAHIRSAAYKARFGDNTGRWLVITTGEVRLKHLMRQICQALGAGAAAFLLTTRGQAASASVLTAPIWWRAGQIQPVAIVADRNNRSVE